jgi:AraC-like DNA-binding protein
MGHETEEETREAYTDELEKKIAEARIFMDECPQQIAPYLTKEILVALVKDGYTQTQIAKQFRVSQSTISRAVAAAYSRSQLEYNQMLASDPAMTTLANPDRAAEAAKHLWDAKESYEQNYARLLAVFETAHKTADRVRALTELRRYVDSAHKAAQGLYNAQRVARFITAVVAVIRDYDPNVQSKIVAALASPKGGIFPLATSDDPLEAALSAATTANAEAMHA